MRSPYMRRLVCFGKAMGDKRDTADQPVTLWHKAAAVALVVLTGACLRAASNLAADLKTSLASVEAAVPALSVALLRLVPFSPLLLLLALLPLIALLRPGARGVGTGDRRFMLLVVILGLAVALLTLTAFSMYLPTRQIAASGG